MKKTLCLALALCLTFAGSVFAAPVSVGVENSDEIGYVATEATEEAKLSSEAVLTYDFETDNQGWSAWGSITAANSNGQIVLTRSSTANGAINSPTNIGLNADVAKYVVVDLTNCTDQSSIKFYYQRSDEAKYDEAKTFSVPMTASKNTPEKAIVDLSSVANWKGTVTCFMVSMYSVSGSVSIDNIAFYDTVPEEDLPNVTKFY